MENDRFQDLVLEHLAKLTQEMTEMKTDVTELKTDVSGLKRDVTELKTDVSGLKTDVAQTKASVIRIENDHGVKLSALFDAREVQNDVNERFFDTLNRIEGKVDRLNLKVSAQDALLKKVK